MASQRGFFEVQRARVLYSPFGLAWLRAREAPGPTSPLLISVLRLVQRLRPPRGPATPLPADNVPDPASFYHADTSPDASIMTNADTSSGPVICVGGHVAAELMPRLLLAVARVQATWPDVAWRFDVVAQPAWLTNTLRLSAPAASVANASSRITLSPPASDDAVDAFVAQALSARVPPS